MARSDLLLAQHRLAGDARVILDVGAQDGVTTLEYLSAFPNASIHAFEPEPENAAKARASLTNYSRCTLHELAVGATTGVVDLHVNSHSGTHSLLEIGAGHLWQSPEHEVRLDKVQCVSLDDFADQHGIDSVDILGMDIQGAELLALRGAEGLLARKAIRVLRLEVEFAPLYKGQPLFWDVGAYLAQFGYGFHGLYDVFYHPDNSRAATWGDALFVAP